MRFVEESDRGKSALYLAGGAGLTEADVTCHGFGHILGATAEWYMQPLDPRP